MEAGSPPPDEATSSAPAPTLPRPLEQADFVRAVACSMWLAGIGAALVLTGWSFRNSHRFVEYVRENTLAEAGRRWVAVDLASGAACGVLFGLLVLLVHRRRGLTAGLERVERLAHRAAPLLLLPLVPVLFRWRIWVDRDLTVLLLIALVGLASAGLWRLSLGAGPVTPERLRLWVAARLAPVRRVLLRPALPPLLVALAIVAYAVYFSYFTISTHYRLETASYDLGIENNLMWNLVHGGPLFRTTPHDAGPLGSHIGYHHTWLAFVLAAAYVWWPRPEMLLVLQALFIALAAWPLYLLARRRFDAWTSLLIATMYLLYPPVHGANLYDFHYPPFMPFCMWFMLYFVERRRLLPAAVFALLSISIREDAAACVALWGVFLVLTGTNPRFGIGIVVAGLIDFVISKMVVMPSVLGGQQAYVHQYADLVPAGIRGFGGVLITVFGNPGFAAHTLVREPIKLIYLMQIFAPLVFLPLRRPIGILLILPGVFFTLLATNYNPMVEIGFQYTFFWTTFVFVALILNLEWVARPKHPGDAAGPIRRRSWMIALCTAMAAGSYAHGAVLQRAHVRGGFAERRFGPDDESRARRARLFRLIARVPPGAKVASSELIVPHVSSRAAAYTLRVGVFDAEYILLEVPIRERERQAAKEALESKRFGVLDMEPGFVLAKRGHGTELNATALQKL